MEFTQKFSKCSSNLEWVPHFDSQPKYLTYMAQDHTYRDQLTSDAAANLYNVNIHIISSLDAGASHVFHRGLNVPATALSLDNRDEHYIAVNGLTQEQIIVDDVPVESVANHEEKDHTKCHNKNNEDRKEGEDDDDCLKEYEQSNVGDDQRETEEEEEEEEEEKDTNNDCYCDDSGALTRQARAAEHHG